MKREILEKPFDSNLIKTRRGSGGKSLSYVEGTHYITRLNDAFDGKWSFEIVEHEVKGREMLVLGKLSAGEVVKMAFGGSVITMSRETGEIVSQSGDLKAAATDALKKACSLLGIGLHLYSSCRTTEQKPSTRQEPPAASTDSEEGKQPRLTQRQLSAIWGMGRSLGLTGEQIREKCLEMFAVNPEFMSKTDASAFIGELDQQLKQAGGAQ